jgi:ribose 5-phosphate isomerase B
MMAKGRDVRDLGTFSEEPVDYPDYAEAVATYVASGESRFGVTICGTGIGMCIAANKIPGIRAALCHDTFGAKKSRQHNDANVLALGAWDVTPQRAEEIVDVWLASPYEGGRHIPRLTKVRLLETQSRASR